jgi:glycosyltransferase involved in cell wall biosynthesis
MPFVLKNNMSKKSEIICLLLPTLQAGGMERVMAQLAVYFCSKASDEVHLVLYGRNIQMYYDLPESLQVHYPDFKFNNRFRLLSMFRRMAFLRRTIKSLKPNAILSFGEYWNSFVLLTLLGLKYPVFISDRCQPDKKMSSKHRLFRRYLYPLAKGVIAQTKVAREIYHKQFTHSNIEVIANPILVPASSNGIKREKIILTVGRLIPGKNHRQLIDLFIQLNQLDWKLVIVGGDAQHYNLKKELEAYITSLNLSDRILLTGSQPDVESYYQKASIFAFTSESEGFPNVLTEAMSFSLPVVAFDCVAGPSDIISNGNNGFLVPLHDYDTFSQRLQALMQDSVLRDRLGLQARESIRRFSLDSIGQAYYDFITK